MTGLPLISPLIDFLYPRFCVSCGAIVRLGEGHICWDCLAAMDRVEAPFCRRCGDPVFGRIETEYCCSACWRRRPAFASARSVFRYRGGLKRAIQAFKYANGLYLAHDFVEWLTACVHAEFSDERFDAVAYVPLHAWKERRRSYNQARVLAMGLGRRLGLPVLRNSLRRVRPTGTQTGLNMYKRAVNVRGAFDVVRPGWVESRRLLLVDDVMTTGATVNEVSRVLKDAGAASVHVVTVARG